MSRKSDKDGGSKEGCENTEYEKFSKYLGALLVAFSFSVFAILSIPIYLYRYILSDLLVPRFFAEKIGRPVTPLGNTFAVEFLEKFPPRCAVVTNIVVEGDSVSREEVLETIQSKWIDRTVGERSNEMFFPELKQYIDVFGGFMFWKQDVEFDLDNHVKFHEIPNAENKYETSERFICSLMEDLVNKPFPNGRSPWEVHMIKNYASSELEHEDGKELTVFMFRFHHALADGFSILYAIVEGLFGTCLSDISLPSTDTITITPEHTTAEMLTTSFEYGLKMLNDLSYISDLIQRPRTAWHISDRRKSWKQLYSRSQLIPVERIKLIREKFGVTFTSVLFSCISAAISKALKAQMNEEDEMSTLIPLPLTGHPLKFKNHMTATVFDLPVKSALQPGCRLMECEQRLRMAKQSTLPILGLIYSKIVGAHLAFVAKALLKNTVLPMGLSNFPGPETPISWKGRDGLTADFAAGAVNGVAGVAFTVFSYRDHLRIAATAEQAVMSRTELNEMIKNVCAEIEVLENIALSAI